MKKTTAFLLAAVLLLTLSVTAILSFASPGVQEITSASELKAMKAGGSYRLGRDIALTDGSTIASFSGTLDGNGKKITGLSAPLFDSLSGTVKNLTLTGNITLAGETTLGALANTATGAHVENVTSEVTISGNRPSAALALGGLVGRASGASVFEGVTNRGAITVKGAFNEENNNAMGGIVGRIDAGVTLRRCENTGAVYADGNGNNSDFKGAVAGIVGISNGAVTVADCLNAGEIRASYSTLCIAGILGRTETGNTAAPMISGCVNRGKIVKTNDRGERPAGIASYLRGGKVISCANLGGVSSNNAEVSGIVGYYNGSGATLNLEYNYSVGELSGTGAYAIIRVNGQANLKPKSNFVLSGKSACNESLAGTVTCADKADLVAKVTAADASFCHDMSTGAVNDGWPIEVWQCTHASFATEETPQGTVCTNCGTLLAASTCDHTFGPWHVTKEPTETASGEQERECTKCGAKETETLPPKASVTPVGGVYTVGSKAQLLWLWNEMKAGRIETSIAIRLSADIDTAGELSLFTPTFTGTIDGAGKTLSGLKEPLFTQFNGSVKNLTLRGDIEYAANAAAFDTVRKAASFALNAESATFERVVSYVNITTTSRDLNAGGLVGYTRAGVSFIDCKYMGTYTVHWTGDGAGIGGIAGWSNSSGGATVFDGCEFGGAILLDGGASGKSAWVGGILGNLTNATVTIKNCYATGRITSSITAGTDYVGGILGISQNGSTTLEYCANKATLAAKNNAGGILGGMSDSLTLSSCANYKKPEAATVGAIAGNAGGKNLRLVSCIDACEGSGLKYCGTSASVSNCYTSAELKKLSDSVTVGGVAYTRYNAGFVRKDSGIPAPSLTTSDMFKAYISLKDNGDTHAMRFVILSNYRKVKASSVTLSIVFKDEAGKTVRTWEGVLAVEHSDLTLYAALTADGESYFAGGNNALFGLVIDDIPNHAWDSVELSIRDTEEGAVYLSPVSFEVSDVKLSLSQLPDYSDLGQVSTYLYNAGPGLASDRIGTTAEDSYMAVISDTTAAKLASYVKKLESAGFEKLSQITIDGDTYYTYQRYGTIVYLYHTAKQKTTRIIADNSSDPLSELSYTYTKKAGDTTELYQYSLNYDLANVAGYDPVVYTESGTINCGMCYLIKLPDNKLIVIDSGHEKQSTAKSRKGLVDFMHKITQTPDGEPVKIATWFFTHAHGDHVRLAADVLNEYHDVIDLESVTYNFPSYQVLSSGYDDNTFTLKNAINTHYPDVVYHKLHTGERLVMAGVTLDVVFTHEDAVSPAGTSLISDFNATSTVLKITMDNKTLMLLGDISDVSQTAIMSARSKAYLKCDMVQVAHHGFNYLNELYAAIDADIALFPQSWFYVADPNNGQSNLGKYQYLMKIVDRAYFAHKYTTKLWVDASGKIQAENLPRYDAQ